MIFFDDFTSDQLDRSKWNVEITGQPVNDEQQAYVDSPETIYLIPGEFDSAHGVLAIQPCFRPGYRTPQGRVFDFVSGRINTRSKVEFTRASLSARLALPAGTGLWSAFWILGVSEQWPQCGEIDIMENIGEIDWASVAIHGPGYSGETPLVNKKYFSPANDATRWHVYSLDWLASSGMTFKIDGELVYRATRAMVEFYGGWVFDNPKYLIINLALGGIYPFKTNGAHSPYFGLPAATVEAIQEGEIKFLVDWVKVTGD